MLELQGENTSVARVDVAHETVMKAIIVVKRYKTIHYATDRNNKASEIELSRGGVVQNVGGSLGIPNAVMVSVSLSLRHQELRIGRNFNVATP
jgi:hypothetical protein